MRKFFYGLFAFGLLAMFASDAEAGCRRFGNGRFLDRIRNREGRIFERIREWASPPKKGDKKECPKCDPKKTGEENWEMPENMEPELIPAPKRIVL